MHTAGRKGPVYEGRKTPRPFTLSEGEVDREDGWYLNPTWVRTVSRSAKSYIEKLYTKKVRHGHAARVYVVHDLDA